MCEATFSVCCASGALTQLSFPAVIMGNIWWNVASFPLSVYVYQCMYGQLDKITSWCFFFFFLNEPICKAALLHTWACVFVPVCGKVRDRMFAMEMCLHFLNKSLAAKVQLCELRPWYCMSVYVGVILVWRCHCLEFLLTSCNLQLRFQLRLMFTYYIFLLFLHDRRGFL